MIVYPREYNAKKAAIFAAVIRASGMHGRALIAIPMSFRSFPESGARTALALTRAKRQPKSRPVRALKHLLIWAQYNGARRFFTRHPQAVALVWNGLTGSRLAYMMGARDAGNKTLYAELSPLPGRITLDAVGVNAENALPREADFYLSWAKAQPSKRDWRRLGAQMQSRPSRRSDVDQAEAELPKTPFLFVPLQVPDDSQIRLFSGWTGSLPGFIAALGEAARALPEGWHLRIKEHPSAREPLSAEIAAANSASGGRIVLDNATDTFAQVAASGGVVTVNSSVGLQAFFHDRPVIVAGKAFFAIPGLVTPAQSAEALAEAFAGSASLSFDPNLRDAFMAYLDQVYYPALGSSADRPTLPPATLTRLLAPSTS